MTGEWAEEKGWGEAREERKQKKKNDFWPSVFVKAFMVGKHLELFWPNNIYLPCFWNHTYVWKLSTWFFLFHFWILRRHRWGDPGEAPECLVQDGWYRNHSCALALKSRETDWGCGPHGPHFCLGQLADITPGTTAETSTFICRTHLIMATTCL